MSDRPKDNTADSTEADNNLFVVGIGASAGGLSALEELFDCLPSDSGAAFVVIQHLSPDFKSLMKELLERHTDMTVCRVTQGMKIQPNSVYLIPPGKNLILEANLLRLEERKKDKNDKHEFNFPIDLFFASLAKNYQEKAIGVILSGTGSDGTYGLRAINETGGIALVQDPKTAEFDGMPLSAIATEVVNQVLPVAELAELIHQCIISPPDFIDVESTENNLLTYSSLKKIANLLAETEGIDFSHYKTSTMSRRIHRRRLIHNIQDVTSYISLLRNSLEERKILVSDLLINVTHFFRDREAWRNIENTVLPLLIEQAQPHEELRFWIAGCSTGEEAYTLSILVHEALEKADKPISVKIFATDIDRTALEKASEGVYPQSIAKDISPERLQKYFIPKGQHYQVMRKLREMLIFSPHDLTKDAGFTRMHLITCRNVLIYMQTNLQQQVLRNFHFSLIVNGILFQGEAESPGIFTSEFNPLNKKWNIYQKRRDIRLNLPHRTVSRIPSKSFSNSIKPKYAGKNSSTHESSLLRLLEESDSTILRVSSDNQLIHVYGNSSKIFQPLSGKIVTDVTKLVVSPLQLPLNTAIRRAKKEQKSVVYTGIDLEDLGVLSNLNLTVIPPRTEVENSESFLVKIDRKEVSQSSKVEIVKKFQVSDEAQRRILELEDELQHTRENLQALVEELETTNEEQQASNEELTSSNEELQSTNEELHSVNEELHTVNVEYQTKIQELIQLNNDIDNLLKSTNIGVIFLDAELRIRRFTPAAAEAISLRQTDLERPLEELSLKIECLQLPELLAEVLKTQQPIELEVKHRERNSYFLMRICSYQTEGLINEGIVISFVEIDEIKSVQLHLETTLREKSRQLTAIETASDGIAILNEDCFTYLNQAHLDIFGYTQPEELIGISWRTLYEADELARFEREVFPVLLEQGKWQGITKAKHKDGHLFDEELTLNFTDAGDLICICRDVSEIVHARQKLLQSNVQLEQRVSDRTKVLASFSDRLKQLHRLSTANYPDLESLFTDYLQTGCQILKLAAGIVSKVENCIYEIVAVESPFNLSIGYEVSCKDTYCAEVIDTLSTVTFERVGAIESMRENPVYLNLKLESFIGTPIIVNGNLYGTLNFSDTIPREREFTREEKEIVELMAKDIGQCIASVQSQAALKDSEARFRNTFEQAAVGIAHVSLEGKFVWVNQKLCQIVGYEKARLMELTFQEITYPDDLSPDLEYISQMLAGTITQYSMEKRYIHHDGSVVWANLTVSLVVNKRKEPEHFISVIEDISDRKKTETALLESTQSKEKLQVVNQAKDAFIAHMSHELRTPLNSILGFSSILQKDSHLTPEELNSVNIVHQSGQHLLTLINDILDFSKITANKLHLEPQSFNLIQFLTDIAIVFRLRAQQKGLEFKMKLPSFLPTSVNADSTRLRQVLYNLLSNAIKFTETGSITFTVLSLNDFEATEVSSSSSQHLIRFQVEDTGIGVPHEKIAEIFAPFGQLNGSAGNHEGTGLGLTISQEIVNLMNSNIQLESKVDCGSKFYFDLELLEVEATFLPTSTGFSSLFNCRLETPHKILIVDDNHTNRTLLIGYLEPLGFILAEANNGREGLKLAQTFQPDAILVDFVMPVMDGKEMIAQIRKQSIFKEVVIIMITANSQLILQQEEIGCQGFLAKPVSSEDLLELLTTDLQLDWQQESLADELDTLSTLITPSKEELVKLLKLAKFGDISAIEALTNNLLALDAQYTPFVEKVLELAENCQQEKLEKLINKYII